MPSIDEVVGLLKLSLCSDTILIKQSTHELKMNCFNNKDCLSTLVSIITNPVQQLEVHWNQELIHSSSNHMNIYFWNINMWIINNSDSANSFNRTSKENFNLLVTNINRTKSWNEDSSLDFHCFKCLNHSETCNCESSYWNSEFRSSI